MTSASNQIVVVVESFVLKTLGKKEEEEGYFCQQVFHGQVILYALSVNIYMLVGMGFQEFQDGQ